MTRGIGIVLGFAAGAVYDFLRPATMPGMRFFFAGIVQVPVSFLMGLVVGPLKRSSQEK